MNTYWIATPFDDVDGQEDSKKASQGNPSVHRAAGVGSGCGGKSEHPMPRIIWKQRECGPEAAIITEVRSKRVRWDTTISDCWMNAPIYSTPTCMHVEII